MRLPSFTNYELRRLSLLASAPDENTLEQIAHDLGGDQPTVEHCAINGLHNFKSRSPASRPMLLTEMDCDSFAYVAPSYLQTLEGAAR